MVGESVSQISAPQTVKDVSLRVLDRLQAKHPAKLLERNGLGSVLDVLFGFDGRGPKTTAGSRAILTSIFIEPNPHFLAQPD
jgi:hypothetical protein